MVVVSPTFICRSLVCFIQPPFNVLYPNSHNHRRGCGEASDNICIMMQNLGLDIRIQIFKEKFCVMLLLCMCHFSYRDAQNPIWHNRRILGNYRSSTNWLRKSSRNPSWCFIIFKARLMVIEQKKKIYHEIFFCQMI